MAPRSIRLVDLTWPEVEQALAEGWTRVAFTVGATEQHGPHLPLGTDTIIGDALVAEAARLAGRTLVAPAVSVGVSEHHLGFAGSMSLRPETLRAVVVDRVCSLARTGFERIVVLPFHGGNFGAVREAVVEARERLGAGGPEVVGAGELEPFIAVPLRVGEVHGISPAEGGAHAGENETSIMLHLDREAVRLEAARAGFVGDFEPLIPVLWKKGMRAVSQIGVIGDPRRAEASRGKEYFQAFAIFWKEYIQPC